MKSNIPSDWDNETWASFCIEWPDSDSWRAILAGLINMPSRGRNWTNDSGAVKDAQAIGDEIWSRFQAQTGCEEMDVRQNPDNPCHLDKDPGTGWEQFADLSLCGANMFQDPPYNGPDFDLSNDDCLDATIIAWEFYNILLDLNTQRASASDSADMFFRTINALIGIVAYPNVNEIMNLSNALWSGSNAGFAEAFITSLREDMTCVLQSNLPDLSGEVLFTVFQECRDILASFFAGYSFAGSIPGIAEQVCLYLVAAMHSADFMLMYYNSEIDTGDCDTCAEGWCIYFDFLTDDSGWYAAGLDKYTPDPDWAHWVSGTGWVGDVNEYNYRSANICFIFNPTTSGTITSVRFVGGGSNGGMNGRIEMKTTGGWVSIGSYQGTLDTTFDETEEGEWNFPSGGPFYFNVGADTWSSRTVKVTRVEIRGTGTNPFGASNCA